MQAKWIVSTNTGAVVITYQNLKENKVHQCGGGPIETLDTLLGWIAKEMIPGEVLVLNGAMMFSASTIKVAAAA